MPELRNRAKKNGRGDGEEEYAEGANWVAGGIEENSGLFTLAVCAPALTIMLAYLTSEEFVVATGGMKPHLSTMIPACVSDLSACGSNVLDACLSVFPPNADAIKFVVYFMMVAGVLEVLPGKIETGPETLTGHVPKYKDNGVRHCIAYTALFWAGSNLGYLNLYDFGIMYDVFPGSVAFLNIFGLTFCVFLMLKGLYFPSTEDSGSSGSLVKDFLWGTELYPRILGWDLKRFVNCRFSMTFWQLAGFSFAYRSYTIHGEIDWGLLLAAVSQYLYLFKFFWWEMGYMRSIDIIVDRAGFYETWGCIVWVPAVYDSNPTPSPHPNPNPSPSP